MEPLNRDPYLWQKAKARAKFQSSLVVYLVVNAGLWVVWALIPSHHDHDFLPWPVWVSVFWGFGLIARGVAAYGGFGYEQRAQREYEQLLREQQNNSSQRFE
jgi:hypothetical protein